MSVNSGRRTVRNGKLKVAKKVGLDLPIEEMWNRLSRAIGNIQNHDIGSLSYEEHYRYAYNLVLFDKGDLAYRGVKAQIIQHLIQQCADTVVPAFPTGAAATPTAGIVLPEQSKPASSLKSSSLAKGKHFQTNRKEENRSVVSIDKDVDEAAANGVNVAASQVGDRTDVVSRAQSGERLLRAIRDVWEDHCACMKRLRDVLKYLDRVYVKKASQDDSSVVPTWDLGLHLFRDTVIRSQRFPIHTHLYTALLTQIQLEREGSVINRSALKSNIDMLLSLSYPERGVEEKAWDTVYKREFEPAFFATSEEFYKAEAQRLLDGHDAAQYLRHVERRFLEEEARVAVYLSSTTHPELSKTLERCLLSTHLNTIIDMPGSGIVTMLDEDRREDLARMYRLFWRVSDGPTVMRLGLKRYIGTKGKEINNPVNAGSKQATPAKDDDAEASEQKGTTNAAASTPQAQMALKWVEDVLAFKKKFDGILRTSLRDDKGCETAINEAFETFVNTNPRSPEFISLFIDENLKKGLKGKTEEEVEEVLQRTITVFRFLHEKDVFERYYKGHLAKRLLQGRSVSDDAERGMMAKLKIECGHGYVQKLQGMLNDMKVSDETMLSFQESLERNKRDMPFDLGVSVLTSTYWPISAQAPSCTMPAEMVSARQAFESFYQARHSGRLLTWHPNHGTADVRVQFKSRKHELNVSTYGLVVLLLFEEVRNGSSLGYQEIQKSTTIADADLMRTLQSLACAKYKILIKEPKGREIGKEDKFTFNEGFQCNLARIKIATIAARVETATERKETTEKVEEERKNQVEACLVRVMKDRKTMTHNELVNEVIRQLATRFQPSPGLVKKRIESLIDREYLERSESSMNVYHYQA
ncbi:hypothetical protein L7F22_027262 [Adiantum nelumboides]|nr:hypothetical protein [Adiantum nelumboides]